MNADISNILSGMLSDPEMLSKAMNIAKGLASSGVLSSFMPSDGREEGAGERTEEKSTPIPSDRSEGGQGGDERKKKPGNAERIALLLALKPYVIEEKRERLELIIKLMSVFDAARGLGIK